MDTANLRIIIELKKFLTQIPSQAKLWRSCVTSEKAFTRTRCLPLSTLVLMILNLPKRSLNIELHSFFTRIKKVKCGKSAFSMQRSKLKPLFFELWNRTLIQSFYHHYKNRVKRWKGYVLLAFDGSVFSLPNTQELSSVYGNVSNNSGTHGVVARCCVMYDVLNKLVIGGKLVSYLTGERSVVMEQIEHAPAKSLLTFDRGYPSFWLFYLLLQKQQHKFVMRAKLDFNNVVKKFVASSKRDSIVTLYPNTDSIKHLKSMGISITKSTEIQIRLVKVILKTGQTEVLMTNLYSWEQFSIGDLKKVYGLRWGVETCFGSLKNQLQIENFSGVRQICIEQDFFANLFVYNLQSLIEKQSQTRIRKKCKNRKYNYQINKNLSLAFLKDRMVDLFLEERPTHILLELQALFEQHLEPIRPNRSYPRTRKATHGNGKYKTLTNYKRAI